MSAIPDVSIASIYGALYFAVVISTALFGITCVQTSFYYVHYEDDRLRTKVFVAALWALGTIHQALVLSGAYKYVMAGLVDPTTYTNTTPELIIQIFLTVLVALSTQGFFVHRIYIFSGKRIVVPALWLPTAIYQFVVALVYTGKTLYTANGVHVIELAVLSDTLLVGMITSCAFVAAGVDVVISIFLTWLLVRNLRSDTPVLKSTAHLVQRLTVLVVISAIWTATFAVLYSVLMLVFPSNMIYSVFGIPLCAMYCNTVLANLNSRMYIQGEIDNYSIAMGVWTRSRV